MQNLYDLDVLLQLAREREGSLHIARRQVTDWRSDGQVRRWLGRQLVRTGTWLASDEPMRPIRVR